MRSWSGRPRDEPVRLGPDLGGGLLPAAVRLARRFEAAWRDAADSDSGPGHGRDQRHPDPDDFLPDDASAYPAPGSPSCAPTWPCAGRRASGSAPSGIASATPTSATRPWSP